MRTAICMHGVTGGCGGKNNAGEPVDIALCKETINKKIIRKNGDIDFFVHSWSVDRGDEILDLYNPEEFIIEPQITFSENRQWQLSHSRWNSMKKALDLRSEYEKKHGFIYDVVMTQRFDMVWKHTLVFKQYDVNKFICSLAPHSNRSPGTGKKSGLFVEDFWFFSNSGNMDRFSHIADSVKSKNNHKYLYQYLKGTGMEIEYTMDPPKDYDLYRWWSGKSTDHPQKWYRGYKK